MTRLATAAARIARARAVLIDWDGCLAHGETLLPGARDMLHALGPRAFILSNNTTHMPRDIEALLTAQGVSLALDHILLAGHQTLCRQAGRGLGQPIHLVASASMTEFAANLGLNLDGTAETLVVLRDVGFTYERLSAAANIARRCRRIVLANPDLTHPGANGVVVPETGALYAAISACITDTEVELEVIGKPGPFLFQRALDRALAKADEAVMLGDNPDTDGAGARAAGVAFVRIDPDGDVNMFTLAPILSALSPFLPAPIARLPSKRPPGYKKKYVP